MWFLGVLLSLVLCKCAHAQSNHIDLGPMTVHAHVFSVADKTNVTSNDTKATANARVALERLRAYFSTGLGHIPPLDPYKQLDSIEVHNNGSDYDVHVSLMDVRVEGAQSFNLVALQIYLDAMRVDFDMQFPELNVQMVVKGEVKSDDYITTVDDLGLSMTLKNVLASVKFSVEVLIQSGYLQPDHVIVNGLQLDAQIEDIQYGLHNMIRSRRSVPASDLTRTIAEEVKHDVTYAIAETIMRDLDHLFISYSVDQIMNMLLPPDDSMP